MRNSKMRELTGKGCLCLIALIFGIFLGNELYWSISVPLWVALVFGVAATLLIARFLVSDDKTKS